MTLIEFDPARLIVQLNNTGLQNRDNPLYQFLYQLIGAVNKINNATISSSGSSSGGGGTSIASSIGIPGQDGNDGDSGFPVPGPAGINGATGAQGPQGVTLLAEDGADGYDGFNIPNPGPAGATGAQGPLGVSILPMDGENGEDGLSIQGPAGPSTGDGWTTVYKSGDTSRNNNTVAADPDLTFAVLANSTYVMELVAFFTGDTASDFRYAMDGPAAPSHVTNASYVINPNTTTGTFAVLESLPGTGSPTSVACATGQDGILHIFVTFANGANAGNVSLAWAQNTTQAAENAKVYAGSYLRYRKVA